MRNYRKIDQVLDSLEQKCGLTEDGRNWLIAACDPFHDQDITLAGYPDLQSASTVVQLIKKQVQITVPAGVVAGSNWDCSIALFPTLATTANATYGQPFAATGQATPTGANQPSSGFGGLTAIAGKQGTNLWPYFPVNSLDTSVAVAAQIGAGSYLNGNLRIIGMAFEVINTTAEINKQGQVTVWRQPGNLTLNSSSVALVSPYNTFTYGLTRMPPTSLASALLLYGSRSWNAAEGCYVVGRQNTSANPFQQPNSMPVGYAPVDYQASVAGGAFFGAAAPEIGAGYYDIFAPYDISGAHFTGLSYNTTLTVNVRWLLERAPNPSETDLVVLATPSACYDSFALELYCKALSDMPPGVMLSENPLGEWFRNALGKVADIAPKIGGFLGNFIPGAGAMGDTVGTLARVAKKAIPKEQSKKKALPGSASTTMKKP